ncbi:MAG TPA: cobaltochelatase subunit CobN [Pyrinomonadaceae bacterium]|nr:cobaltochelatase subunit CobN [Pyrinomonadaceae bacterium]
MNVTVLYVGSSLLAPLKNAEREINRAYGLDLRVAAYNFGSPLSDGEWSEVERDLAEANVVFVIHVMDGENASRLVKSLEARKHDAVVVINCMPELMRHTHMGRLDVKKLGSIGNWLHRSKADKRKTDHGKYLKLVDRLPRILRFIPTTGALTDAKHYLYLFCYFLQPTPANIQSMLLYSLKHYVRDARLKAVKLEGPQQVPSVAIYHPEAPKLFESFEAYQKWYKKQLDPQSTIGLLLMRPQVISKTTKHYDALIRAIEAEGLSVIPAIATLMDNREAVSRFFIHETRARVSQITSLTGFSFVGGPAMNDSAAASEFLKQLNLPYRSAVSLDTQTIEAWTDSATGLNPIQSGMQIAIPEIDGATEPFVYGGIPSRGQEPIALTDRCTRFARRLKRWHNLQTAPRDQVKLSIVLFCFPPSKGNIGTAADLDVFPGIYDLLLRLRDEGYRVEVPHDADDLREQLLGGNFEEFGATANVAYRMSADEYRRRCSYAREVEKDWGAVPNNIPIQGLNLGNVFIGVQPTFGYEGDPMKLMMAHSGSPTHSFMAFYTYLSKVLNADGVIHFGTHGSLEFMPGKQIGLSGECWPDRLIDELPNFYVYSVNNPSEGSIAKRRSYAELISYLTPPIENAGLYKEFANLKELVMAYRESRSETERARLFESIDQLAVELHLN